ncbi:MAG: hypothetical protein Tsb0020_32910 [Haliangiales bacterium]
MNQPLWLRVRAPFAAFRWLQAGVYRATSPIMPYSAAWGLILNLAHIESRDLAATRKKASPVTLTRADAPALKLALGTTQPSEKATLYQQLHSYPVGSSGKELAKRTHGSKYWIAPAKRELLVDLDMQIGIQSPDEGFPARLRAGLRGDLDVPRYGLPFAGDNDLLFDRIELTDDPAPARWYTPVAAEDDQRRGSCRLTVAIDRRDASRTEAPLFAPGEPAAEPPAEAWRWCPGAPA